MKYIAKSYIINFLIIILIFSHAKLLEKLIKKLYNFLFKKISRYDLLQKTNIKNVLHV